MPRSRPKTDKIAKLQALIDHKNTGADEREAARRMMARLRAKADELMPETPTDPDRYYRLPNGVYGEKYRGYRPLKEITADIRADLKLARKLGKAPTRPGTVKVPDPIGDAPESIRISVRMGRGGGSITVSLKGVPAEWWTDKQPYYSDNSAHAFRAPSPELAELGAAIKALMWAYNYDRSDVQVDYFDRGFYESVEADGHGENQWLKNI